MHTRDHLFEIFLLRQREVQHSRPALIGVEYRLRGGGDFRIPRVDTPWVPRFEDATRGAASALGKGVK